MRRHSCGSSENARVRRLSVRGLGHRARMGNSPERAGAIAINHVSCERIRIREGLSGRMNRGKHPAGLMGGWSAEREDSLPSGESCAEVLQTKDYRLTHRDTGRDLARERQT